MLKNLHAIVMIVLLFGCGRIAQAQYAATMERPLQPAVFAPGVISGPANDASPAFSPDGSTVYFSREGAILVSHRRRGLWSKPEIASFSGKWRDIEPAMAPDGSFLVFASNRPLTEGGSALDGSWGGQNRKGRGGNLWKVQRQGNGWGEPTRLPDIINRGTAIFAPAVVNDYSLYFMEATMTTKFRIYRSQYRNGVYQEPEPLPFGGAAWSEVDPAVAPDESFMVFPSTRPPMVANHQALFIVFREHGHWGEPRLMEAGVSGASSDEIEARLSPDHRTLYFSSDRRTVLAFPRTREKAKRDNQRIQKWDNGLLNIWQVDLSPWLDPKLARADSAQGSERPSSDSFATEMPLTATPQVMAAGVISTQAEEFKATVSPDNQTLLYTVTDHQFRHMTIVESRRSGSNWGEPEVVAFSGVWRDGDPSFAPDGRSVLFISNRPMPGDTAGTVRRDFNIWSVSKRADGGWDDPVALSRNINTDESEFAPSVARSGDLYFSRGDKMFVAMPSARGFQDPTALPFEGGDPAISSDERFLVFDRDRIPGDVDLFVSCHVAGRWTTPSRLAEPVNSSAEEGDPSISADGSTLYFFSTRFTPAPVRAPRTKRATYRQLQQEAVETIYNGSRNLYQVDISSMRCPGGS
jgi:Tol biopolymer transport system component